MSAALTLLLVHGTLSALVLSETLYNGPNHDLDAVTAGKLLINGPGSHGTKRLAS